MARTRLFPADVFDDPAEAVSFFNDNRAEKTIEQIPDVVVLFLKEVAEFDDRVRFGVQPGFKAHYISAAAPDDYAAWLYCKPSGVIFQVGDERNVAAVYSNWGWPQDEDQLPSMRDTDVWFGADELFNVDGELTPGVEFCMRLAASWAERRVGSRP